MKIRHFIMYAGISIFVALLTACGGGGGGGGSTGAGGPTAESSPATGSRIRNTASIVVTFSKSMSAGSLALGGTMAAESDGGTWSGGMNPDDTLTMKPAGTWSEGSSKTLTINAADLAGNPIAELSLSFTVDATSPTAAASPLGGTTIVIGDHIVITFSESMSTGSLSIGGTMAGECAAGAWSSVSASNDTLTISPAAAWNTGSGRTLTVSAADLAGNPLSTLALTYDVITSLTRSCYSGPAATDGIGICHAGTQTFSNGSWGPCLGQVLPQTEVCGNGLDDDCDGETDEGCA